MTKEIRNFEIQTGESRLAHSSFGFRHSFGIRHSGFVIIPVRFLATNRPRSLASSETLPSPPNSDHDYSRPHSPGRPTPGRARSRFGRSAIDFLGGWPVAPARSRRHKTVELLL